METIKTTKELDELLKNTEALDVVYIHSECHLASPTWCKYHADGFIIIECAKCGLEIIKIGVDNNCQK